jgi:cellulose synthase/poly-beta-1,6-N-acetylglucosamine synthase-like glycosyltransferase
MREFLLLVFLFSAAMVFHTYVIYPVIMTLFFRKPRTRSAEFRRDGESALPHVAVLVAAYNEEKVIGKKITSVFENDYPHEKITVYVGSDASMDDTDAIVRNLQERFKGLHLVKFDGRVGKISIINHLQSLGDEDILIMTDANVIFTRDTIFQLVKSFRDERVGIVAANIVKVSERDEGISFQEKTYLSMENRIKAAESNAFGLIMGAEGGCYAIRNNLFSKVPLKFIVDDFFITLQVQERGKLTLFNPKAICTEDAISDPSGEYRRKVRISSGNFQNLLFFRRLLLRFWSPRGFAFLSHKVLRWFTPFLLLTALLSSAALAFYYRPFSWVALVQFIGLLTPAIDRAFPIRSRPLKFISHFYLMNYALMEGFFRFLGGIESSVWQPVKRNV